MCFDNSKPGNNANKVKVADGKGFIGNEDTAGAVQTHVTHEVETKATILQLWDPICGAPLIN